jgi:hypothetical protein
MKLYNELKLDENFLTNEVNSFKRYEQWVKKF